MTDWTLAIAEPAPAGIGVVGLILAVVGIAGAIAGVAGYFRASYAKARIEALNGDIEERERRYDLLEEKFEEEKAAREETDRKLQVEMDARKVLQDVVTGKQDWGEITAILRVMDQRGVNIQTVLDAIAVATGAVEQ